MYERICMNGFIFFHPLPPIRLNQNLVFRNTIQISNIRFILCSIVIFQVTNYVFQQKTKNALIAIDGYLHTKADSNIIFNPVNQRLQILIFLRAITADQQTHFYLLATANKCQTLNITVIYMITCHQ